MQQAEIAGVLQLYCRHKSFVANINYEKRGDTFKQIIFKYSLGFEPPDKITEIFAKYLISLSHFKRLSQRKKVLIKADYLKLEDFHWENFTGMWTVQKKICREKSFEKRKFVKNLFRGKRRISYQKKGKEAYH